MKSKRPNHKKLDTKKEIKAIENHLISGELDKAADHINTLRHENPDDLEIAFAWVMIAYKAGDYSKLIKTAEIAFRIEENIERKIYLSSVLSSSYYYLNQKDKCILNQARLVFQVSQLSHQGKLMRPALPEPELSFDSEAANELAIKLLKKFYALGIKCAPYYGTLLGFERDGRVISHDKDIDLICHMDEMDAVERIILETGLLKDTRFGMYSNMRVYIEPGMNLTVDLSSFFPNPEYELGGFLSAKGDNNWSFIQILPKLNFIEKEMTGDPIYYPKDATSHLTNLYGESWTKPDPNYVPFLSDLSAKPTPLFRWFVIDKIFKYWLDGNLVKANSALNRAIEILPEESMLEILKDCFSQYAIETS